MYIIDYYILNTASKINTLELLVFVDAIQITRIVREELIQFANMSFLSTEFYNLQKL